MDDSRTGRPDDEDDDFNDALDDLFGEPSAPAEQPSNPPAPTRTYTAPAPPPPAQQGVSLGGVTRIAVIGCAAIFGLGVVCVFLLAIIGIIFGDPDATSSTGWLPVV